MNKKRIIILVSWGVALIGGYIWVISAFDSFQDALLSLLSRVMNSKISILIFIGLYLVRPFTFIPVGRLSTTAGVFWGRRPGLAIGLGGEMLSACVAFQNGRLLGPEGLEQKKESGFGKFSFMLLRYPVLAVVLSRMSPLPDDVVNYGWGMLRISRWTYIWGSLLGNVIFSVLNIFMGVQIDPQKLLTEGLSAGINRPIFTLTIFIYLVVLGISRTIFKRITTDEENNTPPT